MRGRCVHTTGASLGQLERSAFYSEETAFPLTMGANYVAMGMGLFATVLLVLVCDDTGKPNWLPIGLFEFDHQQMPEQWEFVLLDGESASGVRSPDRWAAQWGYPDLVRDPMHNDKLIERDPDALKVFYDELSRSTREQHR